ncbi:peptidoglycan-associated lipoprotein Pal [Rhizobium sp. CRIBSB]|nr:peptidoglycan-associated lipoprotein Pal [Rhizobium sp. CRIBSB]
MTSMTIFRIAAVGAVVAAMAACTPRPAPEPATPGGPTTPTTPEYPRPTPTPPVTGAALPGSEQDFTVNVGDRVYFDLDSYTIRQDAYARLDAQAAWLARYPSVMVRIEGNADERGTAEYNIALGARRAESVRAYLVQRGVAPARIDTISFGKERPIAEGSNEQSWARNRNGHTAIVSGATR